MTKLEQAGHELAKAVENALGCNAAANFYRNGHIPDGVIHQQRVAQQRILAALYAYRTAEQEQESDDE